MKTLIVLGLLFSLISSARVKAADEVSPTSLARSLCITYTAGDEMMTNIEDTLKNFMENPNPTPDEVVLFLNKHLDGMTCNYEGEEVSYMHYSFFRKSTAFFELFKVYLMDKIWMNMEDESINIDVNAVSLTGPKKTPETVLDYMLRESALLPDGDLRKARIDQVVFIFIHNFEAKTYAQLQKDKQSPHTTH